MIIDIEGEFRSAKAQILNFKKIIAPSAKRAINRALVTVRKSAVKDLRAHIALKPDVLRKDFILLKNATFSKLEGTAIFSGNPIPLRRFVQGSKSPENQAGKKISERRTIKVMIQPGRIVLLKHSFIQRAKSLQVFNRTSEGGFIKRSARSVGDIVGNPRHKIALKARDAGAAQFSKVFAAELKYRTGK